MLNLDSHVPKLTNFKEDKEEIFCIFSIILLLRWTFKHFLNGLLVKWPSDLMLYCITMLEKPNPALLAWPYDSKLITNYKTTLGKYDAPCLVSFYCLNNFTDTFFFKYVTHWCSRPSHSRPKINCNTKQIRLIFRLLVWTAFSCFTWIFSWELEQFF